MLKRSETDFLLTLDQEVLGSSPSLAANFFRTPVQFEREFFVSGSVPRLRRHSSSLPTS